MKHHILALSLSLVAVILIVTTFLLPWYTTSMEFNLIGSSTFEQALYLNRVEMSGSIGTLDMTQTILLDAMNPQGITADYLSLFTTVTYLILATMVCAIFGCIGISGVWFIRKKQALLKKVGVLFGILTLILAIVTILYFLVGWDTLVNGGINSIFENIPVDSPIDDSFGFWYSKTTSLGSIEIGPGIAWYLMIVAGICAWLSSLFVNRATPKQ